MSGHDRPVDHQRYVPMGGDLRQAPGGKSPSFLVAALKDSMSGNLDRIQIIKGWLETAVVYSIGGVSLFWLFERVSAFSTGSAPPFVIAAADHSENILNKPCRKGVTATDAGLLIDR